MSKQAPELLSDQDLIDIIDDDGKGLKDWEINFISGMVDRLEDGLTLNEKMRRKAEEIYMDRVP